MLMAALKQEHQEAAGPESCTAALAEEPATQCWAPAVQCVAETAGRATEDARRCSDHVAVGPTPRCQEYCAEAADTPVAYMEAADTKDVGTRVADTWSVDTKTAGTGAVPKGGPANPRVLSLREHLLRAAMQASSILPPEWKGIVLQPRLGADEDEDGSQAEQAL